MNTYFITTDSTADFPKKFYESEFDVVKMSFVLDGELYDGYEKEFLPSKEFYTAIANGKVATTSMPSVGLIEEFFENICSKGFDILHVSFSSALSSSYSCYVNAADAVLKKYPDRKIVVIDSLCAAPGEGLLVYYALKKRKEGATLEDNAKYLEELKNHIGHAFTVDDMMYLYRGGRVTKSTALIGRALKVKPVLMVSDKGELIPTNTAMGRKLALKSMVEKLEVKGKDYKNDVIFIGHCDAYDDAITLKKMVEEKVGDTPIVITDISPIVGAHLGKGGLTLHYLCTDKVPFRN